MAVDSIKQYQFGSAATMKRFLVFGFLFLLCNGQNESREPKFFFGQKHTVINYRQVSQIVTEFFPSSCIVIEPTLPPCRHVRNLQIFPSAPTRISRTRSPNIQNIRADGVHGYRNPITPQPSETFNKVPTPPLHLRPQPIKTHSHYWAWNLFNPFNRFQNVTHTVTRTEYVTTKVEDPHTVVSFYVKGCRPSRLPFNLSKCDIPEPIQQKKNFVVMAPLKFVAPAEKVPPPNYDGVGPWQQQDEIRNHEEEPGVAEYKPGEDPESETEPDVNTSTETAENLKTWESGESQTETDTSGYDI